MIKLMQYGAWLDENRGSRPLERGPTRVGDQERCRSDGTRSLAPNRPQARAGPSGSEGAIPGSNGDETGGDRVPIREPTPGDLQECPSVARASSLAGDRVQTRPDAPAAPGTSSARSAHDDGRDRASVDGPRVPHTQGCPSVARASSFASDRVENSPDAPAPPGTSSARSAHENRRDRASVDGPRVPHTRGRPSVAHASSLAGDRGQRSADAPARTQSSRGRFARQRGRDGSRVNWATARGTPPSVVHTSRLVETPAVVSTQMEPTAPLPSRPTEQVAAGNRPQRQPLISCHIECCAL